MDESSPIVPSEETSSSFKLWVYILGGVGILLVVSLIIAFSLMSRENVSLKEYGSDLEGFMKAVETCAPARLVYTTTIDMTIFNFNQTSTSLYELKGMNGTTCIMYTELLNSSRAFYSEIPPEIIARNLEVDALMRGLNNTCYYSLEALAQMFLSLQAGNFSIGTDVESDIVCEHQGWQEITLSSQITSLEATSELPPSDSLAPPTSDSFSSENSTSFQQTCLENWVCTDWSVCQNNFQARICTESNSCGTQQIKPSESFPCSSSQTQQNQTRTVTLQVFKQGTGTGTVTNLIANRVIDCGSICSASFVEYTAADLSAAPAPGSTFIGWSQQTSWGAPCSGNGTCYMILGVDKNVTAIFDLV